MTEAKIGERVWQFSIVTQVPDREGIRLASDVIKRREERKKKKDAGDKQTEGQRERKRQETDAIRRVSCRFSHQIFLCWSPHRPVSGAQMRSSTLDFVRFLTKNLSDDMTDGSGPNFFIPANGENATAQIATGAERKKRGDETPRGEKIAPPVPSLEI